MTLSKRSKEKAKMRNSSLQFIHKSISQDLTSQWGLSQDAQPPPSGALNTKSMLLNVRTTYS